MAWQIVVDKQALTEKLETNRDDHRRVVDQAWKRYRVAVVDELNRLVDAFKANDPRETRIRIELPRPEDHSDEYDSIIAMLEQHTKKTVKMTSVEFRNYVEDRWDWKERWAASTASWTSTTSVART